MAFDLLGGKLILPAEECAYRGMLNNRERRAYDAICRAISQRKPGVVVPAAMGINFPNVMNAVFEDQPLLYYVSGSGISVASSLGASTVSWSFQLTPEQIADYDRQLESRLRALSLPARESVLIKEVRIYNMIQDMGIVSGPGTWEDHCVIGPLLKKHTVCEGMSRMFRLLCYICGVPCMCVSGTAWNSVETGPHAWNVVRIADDYVHVDAYWDMLFRVREYGYFYNYLNLSDRQIERDHSCAVPDVPVCIHEKYSFFASTGADVHSMAEYEALVRSRLKKGKYTISSRMHCDYSVDECIQIVMRALMTRPFSRIAYYANASQDIVGIHVYQ